MKHRVILTPRADSNVAEIVDWITTRSVAGADAWLEALHAALDRLESDPLAYALATEADYVPIKIREFSFKTRKGRKYRGVFRVTDDVVYVLHIRGPGQRLLRPEEFDE